MLLASGSPEVGKIGDERPFVHVCMQHAAATKLSRTTQTLSHRNDTLSTFLHFLARISDSVFIVREICTHWDMDVMLRAFVARTQTQHTHRICYLLMRQD